MDTLLSIRAKSDIELTGDLRALLAERISPSILDIDLFVFDVTAHAACAAALDYGVALLYYII